MSVTRRDFMKTAGVSAGVAIAAGQAPFSYAANEKVRVACVGTGGQGSFHITDGLAGTPDIHIAAVCDLYGPHRNGAAVYAMCSNAGIALPPGSSPGDLSAEDKQRAKDSGKVAKYLDYREMLDKEELDAVIISTPLHTHYELAKACLDAGKFVFCEKTMTQTIDEARDLVAKCHETGKFIQVGHQRRYHPKYNLAMKLAREDGLLGRITHVTTQWHRNSFWRRNLGAYTATPQELALWKELVGVDDLEHLLNWRMYEETSGGLFTELATHQCDIANWFLQSVPNRVYATGGLDYWRDSREVDDNIQISYEYDMRPGDSGFQTLAARSSQQNLAKLNKKYTVRYMHSNILANAKRSCTELIEGDQGTLKLTEIPSAGGCFFYAEPAPIMEKKRAAEAAAKAAAGEVEKEEASDATKRESLMMSGDMTELAKGKELLADRKLETADVYQMRDFARCIKEGDVPRTNQVVGLTTTIAGLMALESRKQGKMLEIDPALYAFNFDAPTFSDYKWDDSIGERIVDEAAPEAPAPEAAPAGENA